MSKAIFCRYPRPEALFRLFCFPWAGGGSIFYGAIGKDFPENIEVCAVRPPGREIRIKEPIPSSMHDLIVNMASDLMEMLVEKPFIFLGHSFGSYCCYEFAIYIKKKYNLEPLHIFVSGISPPHAPSIACSVSQMSDDQIIDLMKQLNGTPEQVLKTPELLKLIVKVLRGDLLLMEKYIMTPDRDDLVLSCPITYLFGDKDLRLNKERWAELTSGCFDEVVFPGGHFYLTDPDNKESFIQTIVQKITTK